MPEPTSATSVAKKKTFTNWKAFEACKLVPATISCEAYRPVFSNDASCHTKIPMNVATLVRHLDGEHGGGFRFFLKTTEGKPHPLWKELEEAGIEAHDFRCDVCSAQLRFHPSSIMPHMKAHSGNTRRVNPGGVFDVLLGKTRPDREESDEEQDVAA